MWKFPLKRGCQFYADRERREGNAHFNSGTIEMLPKSPNAWAAFARTYVFFVINLARLSLLSVPVSSNPRMDHDVVTGTPKIEINYGSGISSTSATRAVADAIPVMRRVNRVEIVTVSEENTERRESATRLIQHLTRRHGREAGHAWVRNTGSVGNSLLSFVAEIGSDPLAPQAARAGVFIGEPSAASWLSDEMRWTTVFRSLSSATPVYRGAQGWTYQREPPVRHSKRCGSGSVIMKMNQTPRRSSD